MQSDKQTTHDEQVGTYFDRASVSFDTFYDEQRGAWKQWMGLIDTQAPRINVQVSHTGSGSTAQTHISGLAIDDNLTDEGFDFICPLETGDYHNDD